MAAASATVTTAAWTHTSHHFLPNAAVVEAINDGVEHTGREQQQS